MEYIFAQNEDLFFSHNTYTGKALGRDLLMASMDRRNVYSKKNLLQCTYEDWTIVLSDLKSTCNQHKQAHFTRVQNILKDIFGTPN